ncbi:Nitrate reductase molybdenum cofactor assembly chaperone NarJ [Vibrio ruber DSM 16370]|uniref:Nitrate reductase molybdenum cofactor assembly chaperone NarJ n=1 Tax=Vibrio ruber (strain DSM 16370 / JCM 11486 / BCRC 17186 / CECT 7878 / LMG 23124 / VR1) TaxID=1123498 RepID=A0A1R4LS65_VIBR1|nr:nitrate reductase molybdenum cofactor assembly chaperone [Vibrio ruber]SJN59229.1 Nitrate reductase molybdenum cofactor assembly chaperone NarJ [Vibrio ruber DSM 16370]
MLSLRMIAHLLDYPQEMLWSEYHELIASTDQCTELNLAQKSDLKQWISTYCEQRLFDVQAQYCALFDRGRSLSLLLFEHVHGQSRERGQAMVDLMGQYQQQGLELDAKELPDYLPMYLEYLSILSEDEAVQGLKDIAPILALLTERLRQRDSEYAELMSLLLSLSAAKLNTASIAEKVKQEERDDSVAALDQVWEEEQITFMDNTPCDSQTRQHQQRFAQTIQPQYLDISQLTGEA